MNGPAEKSSAVRATRDVRQPDACYAGLDAVGTLPPPHAKGQLLF